MFLKCIRSNNNKYSSYFSSTITETESVWNFFNGNNGLWLGVRSRLTIKAIAVGMERTRVG